MKLTTVLPRQPFLGLAISAMLGILVADCWPNPSLAAAVVVAGIAIIAWFLRR